MQNSLVNIFSSIPDHYREFFGKDISPDGAIKFAERWRKCDPRNESEYVQAYTDLDYSDELAFCHIKKKHPKINQTKKIIKILKSLPKVRSVADLGCGIGTDGLVFSSLGYKTFCIEPNKELCGFIKFRAKKLGIGNITIINGTEKDLPEIDVAIFLEVIEHFFDPFSSLARIVSKNPRYLIFTESFGHHDEEAGGFPQHTDYSKSKVLKFLSELHYRKIRIKGMWFPPQLWTFTNNKDLKEEIDCNKFKELEQMSLGL